LENIFFSREELKSCGKNVIIGKTVRIRYPELVEIGDNVIIDDFTYISTQLKISNNVHISAGCKIIGGKNSLVTMSEYSTLAPNVVLSAGSDDYLSGVATPMVDLKYKGNAVIGNIVISKHCIVGAGSVILPNVIMKEGSTLGALSLANKNLEEYTLNVGIPAKMIKYRNKNEIIELETKMNNGE
jgi:acetyltransferase-like isoleucine patch superfamily enzyme